jgi:lantibiotic modifying enzyme
VINDVTLGNGSVLLGALWALRHGTDGADELAHQSADLLLAEAEETEDGLDWPFVPRRFWAEPDRPPMPNFSHGLAGIGAVLAVAGATLGRPDLVDAAARGASHFIGLADTSDGGLHVPRQIPPIDEHDNAFGWCHGPTGSSLLFPALARAGVDTVAGEPVRSWQRRSLHSTITSGIPERRWPGFWDNDGRCCGTAGVVDVLLDAWQGGGPDSELDFALHLCDVLVDRAIRDGDQACWRFVEHRNDDPLLPPGVGWMQGAAGIAAVLLRAARVVGQGRETPAVLRMDNWWALPEELPDHRTVTHT